MLSLTWRRLTRSSWLEDLLVSQLYRYVAIPGMSSQQASWLLDRSAIPLFNRTRSDSRNIFTCYSYISAVFCMLTVLVLWSRMLPESSYGHPPLQRCTSHWQSKRTNLYNVITSTIESSHNLQHIQACKRFKWCRTWSMTLLVKDQSQGQSSRRCNALKLWQWVKRRRIKLRHLLGRSRCQWQPSHDLQFGQAFIQLMKLKILSRSLPRTTKSVLPLW